MKILNLKKRYGEKTVLDISEVALEEGKRYALIGANGSGKSTLLKVLSGLIRPSEGESPFPANSTCYMPQQSVGFSLSVKNNLLVIAPEKERKKLKPRAEKLLAALLLEGLAKKNAATLSGGETQRVALARTLLVGHDVLLLDEPTASMDVDSAQKAETLIADYQKETGCTLVFATHSFGQAERLADEVLFFYKGLLVERGAPKELLHSPKTPEAEQFLRFHK